MTRKLLGWTGQLFLAAFLAFAFPVWALWTTATTVSKAERLYGVKFPADWKAVNVNHGHFSNQSLGTTDEHPYAYFALTCAVFAPPFAIFVIGFRNGYRKGDSKG